MVRKMIGAIMVIAALVITALLISGGGPLVPHIVGPISLAVVGVFLLTRSNRADYPAR